MDAAVEEESRPLHHSCVDEARLDVLGGRQDKTSPTFKEHIKARFWYAEVYFFLEVFGLFWSAV